MGSSSLIPFWVHLFLLFNFSFPSLSIPFLPRNNITLYGDAHFRNNAISLTQEHSCPPPLSSSSFTGFGRAFYAHPVQFLNPKKNTTASFSCRFSFSIIQSPLCPFGDGLTFLITSDADSFSLSSGYIGLPGPALNPQDSFIAVEFDTSFDPSLADINDNHIGIDINTIVSFASVDASLKGIDLRSGRQITAWIDYTDSSKLIKVWLNYSQMRPPIPVLVARVDLSEHFKEYMHIGFSAFNGRGSAVHIVDHWRFRTFTSLPSMAAMDTVEEGDCFMCYPDESNNNGRPDDPHEKRKRMEDTALGICGITALVLSAIAIVAIIIFFVVKKKKKKKSMRRRDGEAQSCRVNRVPARLSIAEIESATMGFHRSRIVGSGASATVYKGSLHSGGGEVAVKRFDRGGISCVRNPFITEFATMASCLRHKNLVQLQGWCCEGDELVLVYEYLPNGSLDKVLHKNTSSAICLLWRQRLNIVLGVASALSYLHEECERQIIHRDVKCCNIMLDAEFNAKLGDFGLAEVYEHSSMTREVTIPAGTMGYLAPEYIYTGIPSQKTDVYSFGVVVLEVATGKRPVDDDGTVLVDWVWSLLEKEKLVDAGDPKLKGMFEKAEMERMLIVGLCCAHPNHEIRPTVKEAARILRGEASVPVLPAKKPKMGFKAVFPEDTDEMLDFGDRSPDMPWMTPRTHFEYDYDKSYR